MDSEIVKKASAAALALGIMATPVVSYINGWESGGKVDHTVYVDNLSYNKALTVCSGLTENALGFKLKQGAYYTDEQCKQLEGLIIQKEATQVGKLVKVDISMGQMILLVSFVHNLGSGVLQKSSILRDLNNGQCLQAAKDILKYNIGTVKGKKVVLPGLDKRRKDESAKFAKDC